MKEQKPVVRDTLAPKEQKALNELTEAVNAFDHTAYGIPDDADLYILLFSETASREYPGELLSALCIYHMGETIGGKAVDELVAFTTPSSRRRGCFRRLFEAALPLLRDCIRFAVSGAQQESAFLTHLGASFDHEERMMRILLQDTESRMPGAQKPKTAPALFPLQVSAEGGVRYISCRYGECCLLPHGSGFYLFGMLIYERFRGKGYGKRFLKSLLLRLAEEKASFVSLEVSSENRPAVRLYESVGFLITERLSYYVLLRDQASSASS